MRKSAYVVGMLICCYSSSLILMGNCDRFHPSPQILKDDDGLSPGSGVGGDPIDPTGGGSPGIVIVYKKSEPQSRPPNPFYDDRHHHQRGHHRHPPPPQHGPYDYSQPHDRYQQGSGRFRPSCASSTSDYYCLFDRDYPMDKVKTIVSHYGPSLTNLYENLNHYSTQDYISHDNATHTYRHKGHFVCESDVSYVRPGWAKNWKGEWVAVLNTDVYPQSVRIETCKYPKKKCEYMPPCYKSSCIQRYTYVKLISLDPWDQQKKPTVDVFEIPSACSCFVENYSLY